MTDRYLTHVRATLDRIRADGFYKSERVIGSPQSSQIALAGGTHADTSILNFCANNYLGLANDPRLVRAAKAGLDALGLRHGLRALHLRHAKRPQATRGRARHLPAHG